MVQGRTKGRVQTGTRIYQDTLFRLKVQAALNKQSMVDLLDELVKPGLIQLETRKEGK